VRDIYYYIKNQLNKVTTKSKTNPNPNPPLRCCFRTADWRT